MTMKDILLAKEGRIGRKQFWLGTLVLFVITLLVFVPILFVSGNLEPSALAGLTLISLVFYYPVYCLYAKRRHDRDKSGTIVIIYLVVTLLLAVLSLFFIPTDFSDPNAALAFAGSPLFWVLQIGNLVLLVLLVYLLVVCGFLKGTDGPNQYGPDPLA